MIIRFFSFDDVEVVAGIEKECMQPPWTTAQVTEEVQRQNGCQMVATENGLIAGYAFFRQCDVEAELLRIVVDVLYRRRGIGRELLQKGLSKLFQQGVTSCFLEMRASNRAARQLYESAGFSICGKRPGYYRYPDEAAIIMKKIYRREVVQGEKNENAS